MDRYPGHDTPALERLTARYGSAPEAEAVMITQHSVDAQQDTVEANLAQPNVIPVGVQRVIAAENRFP